VLLNGALDREGVNSFGSNPFHQHRLVYSDRQTMQSSRFINGTDFIFNIESVRSTGPSIQKQKITFEGGFPTFDVC